jgi:putative phosphoribosyl transferase
MGKLERFKDRQQAGALLAQRLGKYAGHPEGLVLALPRGGVPIGFAIATALGLPLNVFMVGKLSAPGQKEFAIGAIAIGGQHIIHTEVVAELGVPKMVIDEIIHHKLEELTQREKLYRADHPPLKIEGQVVILVDDGLATGLTMLVAIESLRQAKPARIVVAVPVSPKESFDRINVEVDELVCLVVPDVFYAVGQWYDDFAQVSDDEVMELLGNAAQRQDQRLKNTGQVESITPTVVSGSKE